MADTAHQTHETAGDVGPGEMGAGDIGAGDMGAHAKDYSRFTGLFKWGAIISFILAAIVVLLIAS